jgi:multiple sugar transport system permease protein
MGAGFLCLGLSGPLYHLYETVEGNFRTLPTGDIVGIGLAAPEWVADYAWAKPALIFMGLWAAFGSNNMLLYLAGLSGISPELYEAADIDGASGWQRFWNVTWPQLANVTFFIFVMSVIGGLQGGFEMARAMTQGGPAGSTTTISYYIYSEGFATGRLGYASAVSWTLFAMVLAVTLFNWKFGNKYTNE